MIWIRLQFIAFTLCYLLKKIFYAGIAAQNWYKKNNEIIKLKSPEGILKRLRKHRLKCKGTNVWLISHTKTKNSGWQNFALQRY